jgi:uncharacterized protein (DUF1684 family)
LFFGQPAGPDSYVKAMAQFREQRAAGLSSPEGWLSLVALEWLKPGDTTVGSDPGEAVRLAHAPAHLLTLHVDAKRIVSLTSVAPGTTLNGKPALAGDLPQGDSAAEIRNDALLLTIIERGDRLYLRVKDAYSPTRVRFHGLNWYPVDPQFRLIARWIPAKTAHTLTIPNVLGQVSQENSPGVAEFTLNGQTLRLAPIQEDRNSLFFIFRDATSRTATYGSGRFLSTALPSNGLLSPGNLVLDFNQAVNPPCGYTPYATCPLPPVENRLAIPIPAGEKRYHD